MKNKDILGKRFDVDIRAFEFENPDDDITTDSFYIESSEEGILDAINYLISEYGYTYYELKSPNKLIFLDGGCKKFYVPSFPFGEDKMLYHEATMTFPEDFLAFINEFLSLSKDKQKELLNVAEKKYQIEILKKEISKFDKAYEEGMPIITDTEYDKKYERLIILESEFNDISIDSPTQKIEDAKVPKSKKVKHTIPMLSQEKCHTKDDIINFIKRTNDKKYIIDVKLDGISIVLKYVNGKLNSALTRGDGLIGYDITDAVYQMSNVPKTLPSLIDIEVRGEIIINNDIFESLNVNGEFKNSRNLVAGTINCLDISLIKERHLKVITYDIRNEDINTDDAHILLKNLGFEVVDYKEFNNLDDILTYCLNYDKKNRPLLNYKIDGLVLKSNDAKIIKELGYTNKYPKSSIAFKFDSQDRTTVLKSVDWQIGRTGVITPVANFDSIEIDGVIIQKASLANPNNIKSKDIKINDTIVVARSNDVIPKIIGVIKTVRNGQEQLINTPKNCPECGGIITLKNDIPYCLNEDCPSRIINRLAHYCSRDGMNIEMVSDKTIESIINSKIPLNSIIDLYNLKNYRDSLENIEGFKPSTVKGIKTTKKIDKMLLEIEKSKEQNLSNLLSALGIPTIGKSAAKILAKKYLNLKTFYEALIKPEATKELINLQDFGDISSQSVIDYVNNNSNLLLYLASIGEFCEDIATSSNKLENLTFVITGTLSQSRDSIKKIIEDNGGKVSGSISSKTNYLLLGEDDGISSKHQKAIDLNIKIISESDLKELI